MTLKVVIVGASIAGLSLANMLERVGIDYVLLEAYPEIAPQVGASIGLLPNGLRILDQLGCYERIRAMAGDCYHRMNFREVGGRLLSSAGSVTMSERLEQQTGYPAVWVDRQMLLQVLYDNLKCKDRVFAGKRAVRVEMTASGVTVCTKDGSSYVGDVLVGADGVHSIVRQEMWRIAGTTSPEAFPPQEVSKVQSSTKCIFGISNRPSNFPPGTNQESALSRGRCYLAVSGPGERVYWFFFVALRETRYGSSIPRFSKEEETALARCHLSDLITGGMTFGDLYENRIASTLVALEEHVFSRWHFGSIVLVGDSAHKVHPITAQGGNGAMESAAHLVNALARIDASANLPTPESIEAALSEVHARRSHRAEAMMKSGRRNGAILCQEFPFAKHVIRLVLPLLGDNVLFRDMLKYALSGPRVEGLPVPARPHATPYLDELPPRGQGSGVFDWVAWTASAVGIGLLGVLVCRGILWGAVLL
ncbi:FAD-dependent urate hydroxylase 5 [Colletotrichum chlorophyti]|uniref:FAD-dependent urate hydroxylase 5 n=1 Tax=Colletotrichum chlorophyti TaxID=708187 RepID=A0A1Q8S0R8_9PEZI|nr:FAD-dependent urate hydroxylase 5 [Colletotrichum chlorophyti]